MIFPNLPLSRLATTMINKKKKTAFKTCSSVTDLKHPAESCSATEKAWTDTGWVLPVVINNPLSQHWIGQKNGNEFYTFKNNTKTTIVYFICWLWESDIAANTVIIFRVREKLLSCWAVFSATKTIWVIDWQFRVTTLSTQYLLLLSINIKECPHYPC